MAHVLITRIYSQLSFSLKPHRLSGGDARKLRGSDRESSSHPKRRPTFTAMYISRSLSRGMDLIGRPLDQLRLKQKQSMIVPSKSQEGIRYQSVMIFLAVNWAVLRIYLKQLIKREG